MLSPFGAYWSCIKTKAGTFTNLPLQQGGFRTSGMWPYSRQTQQTSASPLANGGQMATLLANHQSNDQLTRRGTLIGASASLVCAPTIVRAASLMRLRASVIPIKTPGLAPTQTPQEGFVRRLLFASCNNALKAGRTDSTFFVNGRRLSAGEVLDIVTYARRNRFLS
jgi:hypothetical protein